MEEEEEIYFELSKLGETGKNSNDIILCENIFMYLFQAPVAENIEGIQYQTSFSDVCVSIQAKPSTKSLSMALWDLSCSQFKFFFKKLMLTWPPLPSAFCKMTVWSMDNSPGTDWTRYLSLSNEMRENPFPRIFNFLMALRMSSLDMSSRLEPIDLINRCLRS